MLSNVFWSSGSSLGADSTTSRSKVKFRKVNCCERIHVPSERWNKSRQEYFEPGWAGTAFCYCLSQFWADKIFLPGPTVEYGARKCILRARKSVSRAHTTGPGRRNSKKAAWWWAGLHSSTQEALPQFRHSFHSQNTWDTNKKVLDNTTEARAHQGIWQFDERVSENVQIASCKRRFNKPYSQNVSVVCRVDAHIG